MEKAVDLVVKGRVQGVGFRWFSRQQADRFGIKGWVKNLPNGDVEIFAEGERAAVDAFMETIRQGPSFAYVEEMLISEQPLDRSYSTFEVKF